VLLSNTLAVETNAMTNNSGEKKVNDGIVLDVKKELNKIAQYYYNDFIYYKNFEGYTATDMKNLQTDINGLSLKPKDIQNLKVQDLNPDFIGSNEFNNTSDQEQTFSTASYSHSFQNTTSTAVTKAFSIAGKSTVFSVPIVLKKGIEVTATVNSATTNTTTESETKTFTAPSQSVKVPAHRTYKVDVEFYKKSLSGEMPFTGQADNVTTSFNVRLKYLQPGPVFQRPDRIKSYKNSTVNYLFALHDAQQQDIYNSGLIFGYDAPTNEFKIDATANLTGVIGSVLKVNIYDVTNRSQPTLVKQTTINLAQ